MPHLQDFKALLFDVDGTLTNTQNTLTTQTISALERLQAEGYIVGVCTGKSWVALQAKILPHFQDDSLHVTSGGSQICTKAGEIKWQKVIDHEVAQQMGQAMLANHVEFLVIKHNAVYIPPSRLDHFVRHPFKVPFKLLDEIEDWSTSQFVIYNYTTEVEAVIKPFLPDLNLKLMPNHPSGGTLVDVTPVGVNKALGVQKWCKLMDMHPDEIIGFGDSENDLEFFTQVGYAVAMGNAKPSIKEIANRVIGHTDENGLARYLTTVLEGAPL
ncbi:MAG TPA: HAD family hydrolase [Vitreimonas sp.]|nr:HAD family hydrolase [Vitreimonas sp.]